MLLLLSEENPKLGLGCFPSYIGVPPNLVKGSYKVTLRALSCYTDVPQNVHWGASQGEPWSLLNYTDVPHKLHWVPPKLPWNASQDTQGCLSSCNGAPQTYTGVWYIPTYTNVSPKLHCGMPHTYLPPTSFLSFQV